MPSMIASLKVKKLPLIDISRDSTSSDLAQAQLLEAELLKDYPCEAQKSLEPNGTKTYVKRQYHLVKEGEQDLYEKIAEFCAKNPNLQEALEKSESDYFETLNVKQRKKYKKRRWRGHSYGVRLIIHVAYLLQVYHFAFGLEGKPVNPSKSVLAKQVGICIRTLDKALKILKAMGFLTWKSGKKTWETNTYYIADCYKTTPLRRPKDFEIPRKLWLKQQYLIKKQKFKEFTRVLYEHSLRDIADHLRCREKLERTSFERMIKNSFKTSKDPPKKRKRPILGHLLKEFSFSFKDQAILSCYGESVLRAAIDDLRAYESWGKVIYNKAALLVSRCKVHKEKLKAKEKAATPEDVKNWLVNYLKSLSGKLNFISSKDELDLATTEAKPFIDLKFHKEEFKKSALKVFQKVNGTWIDKIFTFDRPDLVEAIESYLENSLKTA